MVRGRALKPRATAPFLARSQCRKTRTPVKAMAMPFSSAAAMTSASRREPPGWITAVAPAATASRRPSAKGKKASDAQAEPSASDCVSPLASPRFLGADGGDAGAVPAVHLAGADAGVWPSLA